MPHQRTETSNASSGDHTTGTGACYAGVVFRQGLEVLTDHRVGVLQSHTYAGASARALATATSVLRELPHWYGHVSACDAIVRHVLAKPFTSNGDEGGTYHPAGDGTRDDVWCYVHGQGLLWGAVVGGAGVAPESVHAALQRHCRACGVQPYYVPHGCIISPTLDVGEPDLVSMCQRRVLLYQQFRVPYSLFCRVDRCTSSVLVFSVTRARWHWERGGNANKPPCVGNIV